MNGRDKEGEAGRQDDRDTEWQRQNRDKKRDNGRCIAEKHTTRTADTRNR